MLVVMVSSKEVTNVKWEHFYFVSWKGDFLCWECVYLKYADSGHLYMGYALLQGLTQK
jgi:hypothetical protein